jgi:16S rRNA (guanine966-N2)-methyltransferase
MRVIAGHLGGRKLTAPRGMRTRPTSDRVREALFMTLEPLAELRVVDLFAGSGALGIEALSRGAAFVDFVESHRDARRVLEENVKALGLADRTRLWSAVLPRGASRLKAELAAADLVLCDPPYGDPAAEATLDLLGEPGRLKAGARVVYEHSSREPGRERAGVLVRQRLRTWGDTSVGTYVVTPAGNETRIEEPR